MPGVKRATGRCMRAQPVPPHLRNARTAGAKGTRQVRSSRQTEAEASWSSATRLLDCPGVYAFHSRSIAT